MYKNGKPNYNEIIFTTEQIKEIIDLYNNGVSSVKIGKMYGLSHKPILKVLHNNGINVNQKKFVRKYEVDEHFFDNIDTPEKAYVLGIFYSDGSNSLSKSTISVALQEDDKDLLESIRCLMKSTKPLEYLDYTNKHDFGYHYKNQYKLQCFSIILCNDLVKHGVIPNKSLKLTFPTTIDKTLIRHFIRGVYDGDGSIHRFYRNPNNQPITVTITSTKMFCEGLQKSVYEEIGVKGHIYEASCKNGITKVYTLSGRNLVKKFLDWIYEDSTIHLERKYNRYLEYYDIDNSLAV